MLLLVLLLVLSVTDGVKAVYVSLSGHLRQYGVEISSHMPHIDALIIVKTSPKTVKLPL